jgi:hypothetical protein
MGSAAHELDDLRDAADRVVSRSLSDLIAVSASSLHCRTPRVLGCGHPPGGSRPAVMVTLWLRVGSWLRMAPALV